MEQTTKKAAQMSLKDEIKMTLTKKVKSEWKTFLFFNILGYTAWKLGQYYQLRTNRESASWGTPKFVC